RIHRRKNGQLVMSSASSSIPASDIIYGDGQKYHADPQGLTGLSNISNSDAATVINSAITSLSAIGGGSIFVKPPVPWASIPLSASIALKSGITLRGVFPNTQFGTIGPRFEQVIFKGGTVFSGSGIDAFTGNALQNVVGGDIGLDGFSANNGFNSGASNQLGFLQSTLERIVFKDVALPINVQNFQYFTMRQIYAWGATTNFILAQNNNTTINLDSGGILNGGNSVWEDVYCHGCRNVNGAISLIALSGTLNLI